MKVLGYVLIICGVFTGIGGLIALAANSGNGADYRGLCLANGYPRVEHHRGRVYCIRRLNGTDEVVPADQFKPTQAGDQQ